MRGENADDAHTRTREPRPGDAQLQREGTGTTDCSVAVEGCEHPVRRQQAAEALEILG